MTDDSFDKPGGMEPQTTGFSDNDPERTLITLDQLSQTIEVMTSVVNRLRQHLNDQIQEKIAMGAAVEPAEESAPISATDANKVPVAKQPKRPESLVIEIAQADDGENKKSEKTLH